MTAIQNIVGFIFARGGSKGVPRKNVRSLAGKPLLAYAIETGKQSRYLNRIIVSTDDQEIASTAQQWGADVPFMRPDELAKDNAPEWLSWQHAIKETEEQTSQKIDLFVSMPPTSPLRYVEDIDRCIEALLQADNDVDVAIAVTPSSHSPYFNMVTLDDQNHASLAFASSQGVFRRQDAPAMYNITTAVYAARPNFVMNSKGLFDAKITTIVIPNERAIDIDTELDFQIAEYLMNQRQNT